MKLKSVLPMAILFFMVIAQLKPMQVTAQIPDQLNNIIYASPFTNFQGGKGFGLAYERYLNRSKRLSVFVSLSFGFRDYFVIHANNTRRSQSGTPASKPEASNNYSLMLHPGIKFYAGKNTSFLSYVIGTSTFLSYGTEDGYKQNLYNQTNSAFYRYSAGNEIRWGGKIDQYLNFRISERILMEIQGSFGIVHYGRFITKGNIGSNPSYGSELMGLIGISFGCRL